METQVLNGSGATQQRGSEVKGALTVRPQGETEIVMTRSFQAPRELVFEALSKPEHIQRWWGGLCGEMTVCEVDFRPGGAWRFVMGGAHGENGFGGEFLEIEPPARVVQTFEWEGLPGHISTETMTLDERDGRTHMTITSVFDSRQDRDGMLGSGMEAGVGESYDRLEELLREMESQDEDRSPGALQVSTRGEREFVMTRSFQAPRGLVFEALSKPEHIRRWWGVHSDTMTTCEVDFRVGGKWRFVLSNAGGGCAFRGEYREIVRPERIVQTSEFEEMPGHISLETISLHEHLGRTTMTALCVFDSREDRDGMLGSGMEEGVGESYDRLEELLAEQLQAVA